MASPKDPQLSFKPITEGLGFHPFSDGLPYAPTVKTPTVQKSSQSLKQNLTQGTGAVAAGRPTFINPPLASHSGINAGRISVPVATPSPAKRPLQSQAQPQAKSTLASRASAMAEAKPVAGLQTRYGYVYLCKRMMAYLLDCALNLALCSAILSTVINGQDFTPEALMSPAVIVLGCLFLIFCNWAIIAAQEVAFSTSIGKRVFGLTLHGTGMQTFIRAVFFIPSVSFAGLGLAWSIFDSQKRCWHDRAADLQPDEIAKL